MANYGDLSRFPDGDKVSDYAVEAMRWAVDRGLIAGMDDGRLDPVTHDLSPLFKKIFSALTITHIFSKVKAGF